MQHKKIKLSVILCLGLGLIGFAQKAVIASGGNISGADGSVSYSLGQVVYTTASGTDGSVAQGVQQPYEISVVLGLAEAKAVSLLCSAYPNPTIDHVNLKVDDLKMEDLNYQLYDINAKLLESKKVSASETIISMENLIPATYFIKVAQNNKEVKIFKIIKN
ncbi:MAG: T9SS type A sorting domain-containing protein [Bacteroidetes bacterium]|nr:T9SS type A sorting domain-containing protein [Bacteroidota bacterium]